MKAISIFDLNRPRSIIRILFRRIGIVRFAQLAAFSMLCASAMGQDSSWVHTNPHDGDFPLVTSQGVSDIVVSEDDFQVVHIAARDLSEDVARVTGKTPEVRTGSAAKSQNAVLIGTLGKSPLITQLEAAGKIDLANLRGKWESFVILTVPDPLPNVKMGLIIVGSDRRGTAFGTFELSQAIGVSPWYWWTDVAPAKKRRLFIESGIRREGPPSVRYRGIFLNDEDWGLQPWAAKTFEPETGDIGPKTYARIFELLLRLKANTVWPAMHECTKAFNLYPENKRVADDYAIVMGSSHAEPMLRNNVSEWRDKKENYDYTINADGVRRYWDERVSENGAFENVYTLGMRGIHDSPMQGPKTSSERTKVLERIFDDQRSILARRVNPKVSAVPQIFCPYKEVLADYRSGLKVPDDVTVVYPDDNFGYVRTLPSSEEQKRSGGFGVYYHVSYLGRPISYLWLETTPPSLIWEEMNRAYEHKVQKFWMLNVGDLKPGEIGIEFFLQMAWDIGRWRRDNLQDFLKDWAEREFGSEYSSDIASVMTEYYRLNFQRKPEHLQWYLPGEPVKPSDLAQVEFGDEVQQRLDSFDKLLELANLLYTKIPVQSRDAFYELVLYPVRGAAFANRRFLLVEKSRLYAQQGRASANELLMEARDADKQMSAETDYFNNSLAHGKWRHIMSTEPAKGQWQSIRSSSPIPSQNVETKAPDAAGLGVAIEGRAKPLAPNDTASALPAFSIYGSQSQFIDVFDTGKGRARWVAQASDKWIKLSVASGDLRRDSRIWISVDWDRAPRGGEVKGAITILAAGERRLVNVRLFNPNTSQRSDVNGFVESNGIISIEAEHYMESVPTAGAKWQVVKGLGRTGDAVEVFPTTTSTIEPHSIKTESPHLEYPIFFFSTGLATLTAYVLPTHPADVNQGLRFAASLDDQTPEIITADQGVEVSSKAWSFNVLNSTTIVSSTVNVAEPGKHILKIWMVDAGVVLDKLVLTKGPIGLSYLGPPESPDIPAILAPHR